MLGSLGVHRLYLHGPRDVLAWLHTLPTLAGLAGVQRALAFGQDDRIAWILLPLLGLMLAQASLCAIVYGLTPDERWDARHNPGATGRITGWWPVLGVIAALAIGATALMATIAYSGQRFFEWQADASDQPADPSRPRPTQ